MLIQPKMGLSLCLRFEAEVADSEAMAPADDAAGLLAGFGLSALGPARAAALAALAVSAPLAR